MASELVFNLFDELENQDPRVEHYLREKFQGIQSKSNGVVSRNPPSPRLFIGGVPSSVRNEAFLDHLAPFGPCQDFHRHRDSKGPQNLTFIHVTFESIDKAHQALKHFRQVELFGKLNVDFAHDRLEGDIDNGLNDFQLYKTLGASKDKAASKMPFAVHPTPSALSLKPGWVRVKFQIVNVKRQLCFMPNGYCAFQHPFLTAELAEQISQLESLLADNVKVFQKQSPLESHQLKSGLYVLGFYEGQFYRGLVMDKISEDEFCIWFIDYCNFEILPLQLIRSLPPNLASVCPRLGHLAKIASIKPGLNHEAIDWLTHQITYKDHKVQVEVQTKEKIGDSNVKDTIVLFVNIRVTEPFKETTILLSEELVKKGLATSLVKNVVKQTTSDGSSKNQEIYPCSINHLLSRPISPDADPNSSFLAEISHFESPSNFWVVDRPQSPTLTKLQNLVQEIAAKIPPVPVAPKVGNLILALWGGEDDDKEFYRGMVTRVNMSEEEKARSLTVRFVDFGNVDVVLMKDIRPMPKEIVKFPVQAYQCKLAHCHPKGERWSKLEIQRVQNLLADINDLKCQLIQNGSVKDDTSHYAVLWNGDQKVSVNAQIRISFLGSQVSQQQFITEEKEKQAMPVDANSPSFEVIPDLLNGSNGLGLKEPRNLEERVNELENVIEAQQKLIQALKIKVATLESQSTKDDIKVRMDNMEAAMNVLKRNHETLELDLVKNKVI